MIIYFKLKNGSLLQGWSTGKGEILEGFTVLDSLLRGAKMANTQEGILGIFKTPCTSSFSSLDKKVTEIFCHLFMQILEHSQFCQQMKEGERPDTVTHGLMG